MKNFVSSILCLNLWPVSSSKRWPCGSRSINVGLSCSCVSGMAEFKQTAFDGSLSHCLNGMVCVVMNVSIQILMRWCFFCMSQDGHCWTVSKAQTNSAAMSMLLSRGLSIKYGQAQLSLSLVHSSKGFEWSSYVVDHNLYVIKAAAMFLILIDTNLSFGPNVWQFCIIWIVMPVS